MTLAAVDLQASSTVRTIASGRRRSTALLSPRDGSRRDLRTGSRPVTRCGQRCHQSRLDDATSCGRGVGAGTPIRCSMAHLRHPACAALAALPGQPRLASVSRGPWWAIQSFSGSIGGAARCQALRTRRLHHAWDRWLDSCGRRRPRDNRVRHAHGSRMRAIGAIGRPGRLRVSCAHASDAARSAVAARITRELIGVWGCASAGPRQVRDIAREPAVERHTC